MPNGRGVVRLYISHTHSNANFQNWFEYPFSVFVLFVMKFERWNTDTREFEFVNLDEQEYEELLIVFQVTDAECAIEDRIEILKDLMLHGDIDIFYANEDYTLQ